MLSAKEKVGCTTILEKLEYNDLRSLVDTVTKKSIKIVSKSEAIKALLDYSASPHELLSRRKMKKDVLFHYLSQQNVDVAMTTDKVGLIRKILQLWGSDTQECDMDLDDDADDDQLSDSSSSVGGQTTKTTGTGGQPGHMQSGQHFNIHVHQHHNVMNVVNQYHNVTNVTYNQMAEEQGTPFQDSSRFKRPSTSDMHQSIPQNQIANSFSSRTVLDSGDSVSCSVRTSEHQVLGEKFVEWFYNNLNSHNPVLNKTPGEFGPQHFWSDAYLMLHSSTPEHHEERMEGPDLLAQRFISFVRDEQLLFSPNVSNEGIFVKSNPHGMVTILVCGTIHRNNDCLGVFHQVFGLVKDPRFDNNWKIKMTKLDIQTSTCIKPKLSGNPEELLALAAN